jgi:hypothetical protein
MTALTTHQPRLIADSRVDRAGWLDARRGGITATDVRDWRSKRRAIITNKVSGESEFSGSRYFDHGTYREPHIAEWAQATYGVVSTGGLYAHPDNPRHLASPDGYLAGYSLEYEPGDEAVTVEVKTSSKDLTPGPVDVAGFLTSVTPGSHFDKSGYMRQIQWQMYVMNAARCLFIWEPFEAIADPETGHFTVTGPPQVVLIPRDQAMIDTLVRDADEALAVIDAARAGLTLDGLPPASDLPSEHAALVAEYLQALEQEKVAAAAKAKAFAALKAAYLTPDAEDTSIDAGFARVTVSTSAPREVPVFLESAARESAPAYWREHDKRVAKWTTTDLIPGKQSLTVTAIKG